MVGVCQGDIPTFLPQAGLYGSGCWRCSLLGLRSIEQVSVFLAHAIDGM
jgi:hypothetical protein